MVWTRQQRVGKTGAKSVLLLLGVLCDDDEQVRRTQEYIAEVLECSKSTLREHLLLLEQGGWITREKRNGGVYSKSDVITVNAGTFVTAPPVDNGEDHEPETGTCPETGETHAPETGTTMRRNPAHAMRRNPAHSKDNLTTKPKSKKSTGATAPADPLFTPAISEPSAATAEMGPFGYPASTQGVIAEWVDRSSPKPAGRMLGQMSKEVKLAFDAGYAYEDIRTGIAQVATKGLHPSTLASATHHAAQVRSGASQNMAAAAGPAQMATGTQRAMQALAAGHQLQAQYDQQNQQKALGGTASGFTADRPALGPGSPDRQPESGPGNDSGVVGNPQPFRFR